MVHSGTLGAIPNEQAVRHSSGGGEVVTFDFGPAYNPHSEDPARVVMRLSYTLDPGLGTVQLPVPTGQSVGGIEIPSFAGTILNVVENVSAIEGAQLKKLHKSTYYV